MKLAKKMTDVLESVEIFTEDSKNSHSWNGFTLTITGDDEFVNKAFKDVNDLRESIKRLVNQINISFPTGKIGGNQKFTVTIPSSMGPVIMDPLKRAFDSSVEKYEEFVSKK